MGAVLLDTTVASLLHPKKKNTEPRVQYEPHSRAAIYGTLVPAPQFVPENAPENKKGSLGRANAAKFIERLCKYPASQAAVAEAKRQAATIAW